MLRTLHIALALSLALVLTSTAAAAKKKPFTPPDGYKNVIAVDSDKKTFTLAEDSTTYKFTDKTTNYDKLALGTFVKVTLKDNSKDEVTSIDAATPPAKKKKKDK